MNLIKHNCTYYNYVHAGINECAIWGFGMCDSTVSACNRCDTLLTLSLSLSLTIFHRLYLCSAITFVILYSNSYSMVLLLQRLWLCGCCFCFYLFHFVCVTIVCLPIFILLSPCAHTLCVFVCCVLLIS